MPRASRALAAVATLVALAGCDPYLQGNGVYLEQGRTPGPFVGVHVDDGIQATANVSAEAAYAVTLSGDANIVPDYVKAQVRQLEVDGEMIDVLHVWVDEPEGGYAPTIPIRAAVRSPLTLRYLAAIRGAHVEGEGIAAPHLDVAASGGGSVHAKGPAPAGATAHATLDGSPGELHEYPVTDAAVRLFGASNLKVSVSGALSGEVHGTSSLTNVVPPAACAVDVYDTATVVCGPTP